MGDADGEDGGGGGHQSFARTNKSKVSFFPTQVQSPRTCTLLIKTIASLVAHVFG